MYINIDLYFVKLLKQINLPLGHNCSQTINMGGGVRLHSSHTAYDINLICIWARQTEHVMHTSTAIPTTHHQPTKYQQNVMDMAVTCILLKNHPDRILMQAGLCHKVFIIFHNNSEYTCKGH